MPLVLPTSSLFTPATEDELFDLATSIATSVDLPVSTWEEGDPTRTGLTVIANRLSTVEQIVAGYFASAFLGSAQGDWLTLIARETFQVERGKATYASGTTVLKNITTTKFEWEPRGLTMKNVTTGKTYKNVALVTLLPGASVLFAYEAEEEGTGSTALINSLDLQSSIKGVSVVSNTAAVGVDAQSDPSLRAECAAKVSSLSPNGAYQAYEAVAKNPLLTGVTACRKAQAVSSGVPGSCRVTVYVGNVTSLLTDQDRLAVEAAIVKYATPVGFYPTAQHATLKAVNVTGQITINRNMGITPEAAEERAAAKIQSLFLDIEIGGGSGPGFTTGNIGSLLLNERVYKDLESWTPGLVRKIAITSDLVSDQINPGELILLNGVPSVKVYY